MREQVSVGRPQRQRIAGAIAEAAGTQPLGVHIKLLVGRGLLAEELLLGCLVQGGPSGGRGMLAMARAWHGMGLAWHGHGMACAWHSMMAWDWHGMASTHDMARHGWHPLPFTQQSYHLLHRLLHGLVNQRHICT